MMNDILEIYIYEPYVCCIIPVSLTFLYESPGRVYALTLASTYY